MRFWYAIFFVAVGLSSVVGAHAQSLELQRFVVYFKDKANNPYSV
jgi:hypothetical protein